MLEMKTESATPNPRSSVSFVCRRISGNGTSQHRMNHHWRCVNMAALPLHCRVCFGSDAKMEEEQETGEVEMSSRSTVNGEMNWRKAAGKDNAWQSKSQHPVLSPLFLDLSKDGSGRSSRPGIDTAKKCRKRNRGPRCLTSTWLVLDVPLSFKLILSHHDLVIHQEKQHGNGSSGKLAGP